MALDRMTADLAPGEAPTGARLRTPQTLKDATGTPVAMITVDVVDGEQRAYLVVPEAPGVESTVTRIRDDLVVVLALTPNLEVELGLAHPAQELEVHDVEVELGDGTVVRGERGVIRPLKEEEE